MTDKVLVTVIVEWEVVVIVAVVIALKLEVRLPEVETTGCWYVDVYVETTSVTVTYVVM